MEIPPKRMTAFTEESVTFRYKLNAIPKPTITWFHDGVMVDAAADYIELGDNYLTVKDLIRADKGMYQIRVSNSMGDAQASLELLVLGKAL